MKLSHQTEQIGGLTYGTQNEQKKQFNPQLSQFTRSTVAAGSTSENFFELQSGSCSETNRLESSVVGDDWHWMP